jgi:signal transduction histidine kinase
MKGRVLRLLLEQIDPIRVRGNRERLRQMLMNLIINAIKFTPDHGTISLSLTRVGDQALLKVADTGIGIAAEDQQRIYDRFFQADPARVHKENDGAGLGLSIAKWIVDIHHGQIVVHSTVGQGTSFHVTLPALPHEPGRRDDIEDDWPEISRKTSAL